MNLFLAFIILVAVIFNYLQYSIIKDLEDKNLLLEDEFAAEKADYDSSFKQLQDLYNKELKLNNINKEAVKGLSKEVEYFETVNLSLSEELKSKRSIIEKLEKLSVVGENINILPEGTVELISKTTNNKEILLEKNNKPKTIKRQPRNKN